MLKEQALQNASNRLATSIVHLNDKRIEARFVAPILTEFLGEQIRLLKTTLKEIEKTRLLEEQVDHTSEFENLTQFIYLNLEPSVRKIQYQAAKLEFIEELFFIVNKQQPDLDLDIAYATFSDLRQELYNTCEEYFQPLEEDTSTYVETLRISIFNVNSFLVQLSSGMDLARTQPIFIKEMLAKIISELTALSLALG